MTTTLIQLFARPPLKGKVKTRLIPHVGAQNALSIYRYCLRFNLNLLRRSGYDYQLWLSEHTELPWLAQQTPRYQQGENLGQRMHAALSSELSRENRIYERVILIGSDCLDLTTAIFNRVNSRLDAHELVIIPATDGGYVLIAAKDSIDPLLFEGISWGSPKVLRQTLQRVMQCGVNASILNPLRDIDRYEDLQHYAAFRQYL